MSPWVLTRMVLLLVSLAGGARSGRREPGRSLQFDVDVALAGDHPVALVVIEIAAEDAIGPARSRRSVQGDVHIVQEHVPGLHLQFLRRLESEKRVSLAGLRVAEPVRRLLNVHAQTGGQVLFDVPEAIAPVNDEAGDEGQQQGRRHHNPPAQSLDGYAHTCFIFSLRAAPGRVASLCAQGLGGVDARDAQRREQAGGCGNRDQQQRHADQCYADRRFPRRRSRSS